MAQAEINQFVIEQRARKRTKSFVYIAIGVVVVGVIGFFWWQSARKEAKEKEVAEFFQAFRKIDDGDGAAFWKCAVRAKQRDVHLASHAAEITEGLTKAFNNYPSSQPGRLRDKCIPMINSITAQVEKLKPPSGFTGPLEDYKTAMKEVKMAFEAYANKIEGRKQEAMVEQEIRQAHRDFHSVILTDGSWSSVADTPKAVMYYNIMNCVIPDFIKEVRKINKPPDSQPIVDLYHKCKADPSFANKIRRECYEQRNATSMRTKEFKLMAQKMCGDDRDLNTINYCFRKANHGFAFEELKGVAEAFGRYRNKAKASILKEVQKIKEELAE